MFLLVMSKFNDAICYRLCCDHVHTEDKKKQSFKYESWFKGTSSKWLSVSLQTKYSVTLSAGAEECTDCFSAAKQDPTPMSILDMTLNKSDVEAPVMWEL